MKKKKPEHQRLLQLQKRIYRNLQGEADRLLGSTPDAIKRYERTYLRDFRGFKLTKKSMSLKSELIASIRGRDVTFIADYHSFDQAQKTALRLIREVIHTGEIWTIGLEMIPSHLQWALDRFQAEQMSLDSFHQAIRYRAEWGFPWRHYAPIFDWARKNKVRLIALNRPKELSQPVSAQLRNARRPSDLHARDLWAAGVITDFFADARAQGIKNPRMIVLYGELHVARDHLGRQLTEVSRGFLGRALRSISIHQNNDRMYWDLARLGREHQVNVLKLKSDTYCVVSATPWNRLQSLINWAEGEAHQTFPGDDDIEGESGGVDYLSSVRIYGEIISEFLELPKPDFSTLSVMTLEDADFVDDLRATGYFKLRELKIIRDLILRNERFYLPRVSTAYLASPSYNAAAEMASLHVLRARSRSVAFFEADREDFYRLILESAFGFFGSLIINPRRKCDLPKDHLRLAKKFKNFAHPDAETREEIIARTRTHQLLASRQWSNAAIRAIDEDLATPGTDQVSLKVARYVGQVLGYRSYHAVVAGQIALHSVRQAFIARVDGSHRPYSERYETLLTQLEGFRMGSSKTEQL